MSTFGIRVMRAKWLRWRFPFDEQDAVAVLAQDGEERLRNSTLRAVHSGGRVYRFSRRSAAIVLWILATSSRMNCGGVPYRSTTARMMPIPEWLLTGSTMWPTSRASTRPSAVRKSREYSMAAAIRSQKM
jgi:hypothetical protein